jgi:PAS domain S-box-containing protein
MDLADTNASTRREGDHTERYRALLDSIDEGYSVVRLIFDESGRASDYIFEEVNAAFEKHTGLRNAVGRSIREMEPNLEEHWFQTYGRVAMTGKPERFENVARPLQRWFDVYAFRIDRPEDRRVAILFSDITERKRTEAALHDSEMQFRTLADTIPQLAWMAGADGWIYWYNRRWYEYTGTTADQMEGWGWERVHDPRTLPEVVSRWRASIAGGEPLDMVFPLRGADGKFRQFLTRVHPMRNSAGQIVRWFGTNTDVDELKRTEAALRDSEQRFRSIFENAGTGIAITDLRGRFEQTNPAFCNLLGYRPEELQQASFDQIIHPDDRCEHAALFHRLLSSQIPPFESVHRYIRKTGEPLWVQNVISILPGQSARPTHALLLVTDLTEQRRSQETLRQLNATLEQRVRHRTAEVQHKADQLRLLAAELVRAEERERRRVARILHDDLQQTLVSAQMRIDLIQSAAPPLLSHQAGEVRDMITEAIQTSRSLTSDLSPPILYDAGLVPALRWLAARMLTKHSLTVHVSADPADEPTDLESRVFLFQAAREMLFNVTKHAGVSEALLTLSRIDHAITMTVHDQGRGFNPHSPASTDSGSGLGIFSVRERAQFLGGTLDIQSSPAHGTRLTLRLPQRPHQPAPAPLDSPPASLPPAAPPPDPANAIRVLLADDHPMLRESLARLLQTEPDITIVAQAADGVEASALCQSLRPHIVLMDITMPHMDGIQATRLITAQHPSTRVIGLSMHEGADMETRMLQAGASAYLRKDGHITDLLTTIRKHAQT